MKPEDKKLAEAVLRRLCQGAQIDGIRFGPILQVLITDHATKRPPIRGQIYLNLDSSWTVFGTPPVFWPLCAEDLPQPSVEEQLRILCGLREAVIADVVLGEQQPHLRIYLEDGRVFFVNGHHEQYECWQVGVAWSNAGETGLIVGLPGDDVAVWTPVHLDYTAN